MRCLITLLLVAGTASASDVPLREYLESRVEEQDRRIEQKTEAEREARELLRESLSQRLDLLFDAQKAYDAANYATLQALADQKVEVAALQQSRDIAYGAILAMMFVMGAPLMYLVFKRRGQ